jgi:hypothetical protein
MAACACLAMEGVSTPAGADPIEEGPRAEMPIVLTGDQLPELQGVSESAIAAFRWTGTAWQRIPLQVDPVRVVDLCEEVDYPLSEDGSWPSIPPGSDPAVSCEEERIDFSGQLEGNATLDGDDQIVFLIAEAGRKRPAGEPGPAGSGDDGYEIAMRDPGDDPARDGYVYLFAGTDVPEPAGYAIDATTETGRLASDLPPPDCLPEDNEYTTIETDRLCAYYATRWSLDDLVLKASAGDACDLLGAGEAEPARDLLDRWKGHENDVGNAVDDDYWGCRSSFVDRASAVSNGQKTGPVRHVRGVLGAKSGVSTTVYTYVYPGYVRVETRLRVHEMIGIARLWDWNGSALDSYEIFTELAGGGRSTDAIDGELSTDCEVIEGRFNGACVRRSSLREAGAGADTWSLLSPPGTEGWRPFLHTLIEDDPAAYTKDPSLSDTFKGMKHFYADFDGPGTERRLNERLGDDELEGSPGNAGVLFDLRTPYESCQAVCDVSEDRCRRGPLASGDEDCFFGTYYQPLRTVHSLHLLEAPAAGEDPWVIGAERARLERQPVELSIRYGPPGEECTDGDGDGWGDPNVAVCPRGPGADDCDDADAGIHPEAPEVLGNGVDDDCDGLVDERSLHRESLATGWSFAGAPLDLEQTAEAICRDVAADGGSPEEVTLWRGADWIRHGCGSTSNDFDVPPGEAPFVRASSSSTWTRRAGDLAAPFEIRLADGRNAISLPRWARSREASAICVEIEADGGSPRELSAWSDGRWTTHVCGRPFHDFSAGGGDALFVRVGNSSTWTIED